MTNQEKITLHSSLFRGRTDAYPRRWEKNCKSGWAPAYSFDWNEFNTHRAKGGTIKDFEHKTLSPLTDEILLNHLLGKEIVGVYPILSDNTSHFIAADFDEKEWEADSVKFIDECVKVGLSAYAEISRSGNGCHVWIFFGGKYPCWKSRAIILEIIRKIFNYSEFSKEISFDRLFPNQDTITDGGFGNLIALPLQGDRVPLGFSIFCDFKTFTPFKNQWEFLKTIRKNSNDELDCAYTALFGDKYLEIKRGQSSISNFRIRIKIDGSLHLGKSELPAAVVEFIKDQLNVFNKEYATKKRLGKSVFGTEKYFNLIQDTGGDILLPRGFLSKLETFLKEKELPYEIIEGYKKLEPVQFKSVISLREEQEDLLEEICEYTNGIIVAPPGSGKTIIALELVARLGVPALILVNRNQLLSQWVERIQQFLGIPKIQIGVVSGTKKKVGKQITVATLQSLAKYKNLKEITDSFGVIIVDECHHVPAKTYRELIRSFKSKYFFGLTATHERKYGMEKITELIIGPVIAEMTAMDADKESKKSFEVSIFPTQLFIPFRYTTDHYETLAKTICYDSARNEQVVKAILEETKLARKVLVLTERKEHIEMLKLYLGGDTEVIAISGDDSARSRKIKIEQIHAGNFQVILTTGQLLGEGFDLHGVSSVVLAFPFSFEGKITQYVGRLRGEGVKHILDFRDEKVEFLERQFKQRNRFYKKLQNKILL
ncbi:MAG: Type III restriction enzyme, res subunit:DEAD/DEAH box helicase [Parcubacteria group bacterium GW2011_GWA1_47_8]|nr:MAG: Type III restriction enzyme, res subunit:DEAD/DEAH box helicase [Parcubacteria group bacterium GW2011_GWA1_47_8]